MVTPRSSLSNSNTMSTLKVGGIYRHYKGKRYYVLAIATHSETLERLVVYVPLYDQESASVWVRPESMFLETVVLDGKTVQRFTYEDSR